MGWRGVQQYFALLTFGLPGHRGALRRITLVVHSGRLDGRGQLEGHIVGIESILVMLIVGAIAGWLAGLIVKGFGFGLLGNIVVGIVGAFVAGLVLPAIGLSIAGGIVDAIIYATIGAVILLFIIKLVKS
jgi:uncharacterized membrane protein YeaQ/YmgE (transglycosylase-associated protein family)